MTYNQIIKLNQDYCTANKQIKTFGTGEEWETEGILKPGILYPIYYFIPVDSTVGLQSNQRKFQVLCFDIVKKDKTNEQEVLSDCEQIIQDHIRFLRNNDDFDLIGDPVLSPFKEKYGDFCAGWGAELIIETDFNSNDCEIPMVGLPPLPPQGYATVTDQNGNITKLYPGDNINVVIASGINEGNSSQTYTNQIIEP